jgi:pimeloyl-ACP methyl ester carboxylesterase
MTCKNGGLCLADDDKPLTDGGRNGRLSTDLCRSGKGAMTEMSGSVVTDDGVRLGYKVVGEGPHNLLLMHGWGGSANSWNGFNQWLDPRKFRAIAFDIRGHGDSAKTTSGYTDERFVRDALAVADAADARKFLLVGFSMSGRFVQYLPLLAGERVEGMAIIAGCPASAMALPEEVISDWVGRAGSREKLREIPLMFAVKPDMALIDEYADDAAKGEVRGSNVPANRGHIPGSELTRDFRNLRAEQWSWYAET